MSGHIEHLRKHLYDYFGKDIEIALIRGVGWNPRCHVEADIAAGSRRLPIFLKCLKPEWREVEMYAYERILPFLGVRVPHLYGSFSDAEVETEWVILERIEGRWIQTERKREVLSTFELIGRLHGASKMVHPSVEHPATDLLVFPSARDEHEISNRRCLLEAHAVELGLDERVVKAFDRNVSYLRVSPMTWIHGDNDISNILVNAHGLCLIDWERFAWAPPALDLGELVTRVLHGQSMEYLEAYRRGYQMSSGETLSLDQVSEWIEHGMFFDDVKWICYYSERMSDGNWDRQGWYDTYVVPRISRINGLISDGILI